MQSRLIAAAALAAVLAAGAAQAQSNVYRWVDQDGKVHFSDTPPPEEAKSVSQKRMGGGYVDQSQLPYATQVAMKKSPVTLYVANDCADACGKARAFLSQRGIPFTERNAQTNPADTEELRKLSGALEVPFLLVGASKLRGYDPDGWNAALDAAGYPRERLPGQPPTAGVTEPVAEAPKAPSEPAAAQ
jgi:glutaredoxin